MISKKGLIGGFISMFVATVVIVIILIVYVLLGAIISTVDASAGQILVEKEEKIGLGPLLEYEGHAEVIELRSLHMNQASQDDETRWLY